MSHTPKDKLLDPIRIHDANDAQPVDLERVEGERAQRRQAFFAEAGKLFAGSLDAEATLQAVVQLAVPAIADACSVLLLEPDGSLRRVAEAALGDEAAAEIRSLREHPDAIDAPVAMHDALALGRTLHFPDYRAWLLERLPEDHPYAKLIHRIGTRSAIAAPLIARGRTLGVLTLGMTAHSGRVYDLADLAMIDDVAPQVAAAIENARLYAAAEAARAQAEQEQHRLHDLFMQAPAAVAILRGPTHVFELANPRYRAMVGDRDVVGRSAREALPELALQPFFSILDRVLATGEPYVGTEVPAKVDLRGDGKLDDVFYDFVYQPMIGPGGQAEGIMVMVFDVTEKRRAERSLRFLTEASVALSGALDYHAAIERVAEAAVGSIADWCTVYLAEEGDPIELVAAKHAVPTGEAVLRELHARFPPEWSRGDELCKAILTRRAQAFERVDDAMLATWARDPDELELLRQLAPCSWMAAPLVVSNRALGVVAFGSSRSARRFGPADVELAEELARLVALAVDHARLFDVAQRERVRAEKANRAKDEFLAAVSHELRTPLNAILGWTRILRGGSLPEERRERALETIERNARVQTQLIEDLLDISRIVAGKLRLEMGTVDLAGVIEAALDGVRPDAGTRGITLSVTLDRGASASMGDPDRLQQVIWNLLNNSIKFTPRGGTVDVRLERASEGAKITVKDTGCGISPAFLPRVFDQFRQEDGATGKAHGGLGLGLAIAANIVALHGGSIAAHSDGEGRGAMFTVTLPLGTTNARPDGSPVLLPMSDLGLDQVPDLCGVRVLVVDDESDARELLSDLLQGRGAEVLDASSASEGLELLRRERPDVLISDIGMPGETGYDLIRHVRELPPEEGGKTPAVALTAFGRADDRTRALVSGFDMHVPKPVEPAELIVVIGRLVGAGARASAEAGPRSSAR